MWLSESSFEIFLPDADNDILYLFHILLIYSLLPGHRVIMYLKESKAMLLSTLWPVSRFTSDLE